MPGGRDEFKAVVLSRRHWFFDLDGTVYLGSEPLPGAIDLLRSLESRGAGWTFLTNNSSRSSAEYLRHLEAMGLPLGPTGVVTSGRATASWLLQHHAGARVFLLGTPSLAQEMAAMGVDVVGEEPDLVVLGYDTTLHYERLARACRYLRSGLPFVATHPDVNCPTPEGPVPDAGAFMALIEASTGRIPDQVVGKPNVDVLQQAAAVAGIPLEACAMVGDRLETDMVMARDAGATAVLVLTGATAVDDPRLEDPAWASWLHVARGLPEIHELLESPT